MIQLSNTVDIVLEDQAWAKHGLQRVATDVVGRVLAHVGLMSGYEVVVLGCHNDRIAELNTEFRAKPKPTNVLSWPAQDLAPQHAGGRPLPPQPDPFGDTELGDIALALGVCQAEATTADIPFEQHLTHLIVHGTLHLLGYDHISDTDAARMEALEVEILATLGQPDPYGR